MLSKQADSQPVLFPEILGEKRGREYCIGIAYPQGSWLILPDTLMKSPLCLVLCKSNGLCIMPGNIWALPVIFSQMEVIKFKELLLPGQCLDLSLCYHQAHCKLQFSYRSETTEYSSGRIYFYDRPLILVYSFPSTITKGHCRKLWNNWLFPAALHFGGRWQSGILCRDYPQFVQPIFMGADYPTG